MKLESTDYYENSSQSKHDAINMHDIIPNVMVTPQQPVLNIPATSQPFITYNEAERKISLAIPTECSTSTDATLTSSLNTVKKASRPFKAYPKNILSMVPSFNDDSNEKYTKFREKVLLESVKNGNTPNSKTRMSKNPGSPTSTTANEKDHAYWERRKKNNEAAKRSREARRAKEDELAIRAAFLEHENAQLKGELQKMYSMYKSLCSMYYQLSQMSPISS